MYFFQCFITTILAVILDLEHFSHIKVVYCPCSHKCMRKQQSEKKARPICPTHKAICQVSANNTEFPPGFFIKIKSNKNAYWPFMWTEQIRGLDSTFKTKKTKTNYDSIVDWSDFFPRSSDNCNHVYSIFYWINIVASKAGTNYTLSFCHPPSKLTRNIREQTNSKCQWKFKSFNHVLDWFENPLNF